MSGKSGTIVYDSSSHSPSTMAERNLGTWKGRYGEESPPIDIFRGWDKSNVQTLVEIIEGQTHTITSVLLNQKEPVEILQVINLVAGLSRALKIVVNERDHMRRDIDSLTQRMNVIHSAPSATQNHPETNQMSRHLNF